MFTFKTDFRISEWTLSENIRWRFKKKKTSWLYSVIWKYSWQVKLITTQFVMTISKKHVFCEFHVWFGKWRLRYWCIIKKEAWFRLNVSSSCAKFGFSIQVWECPQPVCIPWFGQASVTVFDYYCVHCNARTIFKCLETDQILFEGFYAEGTFVTFSYTVLSIEKDADENIELEEGVKIYSRRKSRYLSLF